jgi:phosphoserine / homoserine phosphotransferase
MWLICLDLEGVLFPEVWIAVAERTSIPELRLTTRDIEDYDELMNHRLGILEKHRISISDIQGVIDGLDPLPGAADFLAALRRRREVVLLSDTFEEYWQAIKPKFGYPTMFCNHLVVDDRGRITGYRLRRQDGKRKAVTALQDAGFQVCAVGDSFNDLAMIVKADQGVLFRSPDTIAERHPTLPRFDDHPKLLAFLDSLDGR